MNYISTRDKSLNFNFDSIFLRGLAPDGGLFLPKELKKFSEKDLIELSKLSYIDLGVEIIAKFCSPVLDKRKIKLLLSKAYSSFNTNDVVKINITDVHKHRCTTSSTCPINETYSKYITPINPHQKEPNDVNNNPLLN